MTISEPIIDLEQVSFSYPGGPPVLQDLNFRLHPGERIGIIDRGRLVGLGTVDELHAQSAVSGSLEDIFLELTGGPAYAELAEVLGR